jgi:hypothetical protein
MSTSTQPHTHEFACTEPASATIRFGAGTLHVVAADRPGVSVLVSPYDDSESSRSAAANASVQFDGGQLRVDVSDAGRGWLFRRGGRVRVELRVPLDSQIRTQVGSADISTEGRLREVGVRSGSGDGHVAEAAEVSFESGSGDLRVDRVTGSLRAKTASGDVSAVTVSGSASVDVASGDIEIGTAYGSVRATTASGDIRVGAAHSGRVQVNSVSGDVEVGIPTGTRVWLDLNTVSGSTTNDLDMAADAADRPHSEAAVNLHVRTVSGDIAVRRVAGAGTAG